MSNSEGMHSPVEQFEIKPLVELSLGGYDVSFTNSSLFMLLAIGFSAIFLISAMRRADMVPGPYFWLIFAPKKHNIFDQS